MTRDLNTLIDRIAREFNTPEDVLASLDAADGIEPVPSPDHVIAILPEKGITVGLHRLLARAHAEAGDTDAADRVSLQLAERLNQAGFWKPLVRLVTPLLERHPQQIAPLLVRIRHQAGVGLVDAELLYTAHARVPQHGLLAWEVARSKLERNDEAGARRAALQALPELIEDKNHDIAEEALLLLAEMPHPASIPVLLRALELLARQEVWDRFLMFLELAMEQLASSQGAEAAWPVVSGLWLKYPDREVMRPHVVRIAEAALEGYPDPRGLIRVSRLNIPSEDAERCLERLARAMAFPPGYYASHVSWGIGKIRENDTEALVIDFPEKPLHRMTLATAERALDALEPGDLRVLCVHHRDELARLVEAEPVTVIVLTLHQFKEREATVDKLRKILVPAVVPASGWAGWWKTTRKKLDTDPRIDTRRAYQNVYRIPDPHETAEDVTLPEWNPRLTAIKNVSLLDTFLEHHPDQRPRLLEALGPRVVEVLEQPRSSREDRAAAWLWLRRAGAELPSDGPGSWLDASLDFNALAKSDQLELLEALSGQTPWTAALNSRLIGIRREAWNRLRAEGLLGSAAARALGRAASAPEAALHVLETGVSETGDAVDTRTLVLAVLDLIETPLRDTHRKRGMVLLAEGSALAERVRERPLDDEAASPVITRLKSWRASDKYRFPILDFFRDNGHEFIAESVEGHRARRAAKVGARVAPADEDPYEGDVVLTRPSLDRLEAERIRIGMELKTEIPRIIQSARDFGDLKENAEYHAAKAKQAEYAQRYSDLAALLGRVRLIEDMEREAGVAAPGTEVELEAADGGGRVRYWLLGEGDQDLGEEVVSYKAPIGRVLNGRRVGDTVELPPDGRPFRVASVGERLP
jgi:transcription elongation factor GreA